MPKLAPTAPDDMEMGSVYGPSGTTRPWGLYLHRFEFDVSTMTPQDNIDIRIFEPDASVRPIMVVAATWVTNLGDVNMDNTEVAMGTNNPTYDNLILATPISQADNGDVYGNTLNEAQTDLSSGLLLRDQGSVAHPHWERPLSGWNGGDPVVGLPVYAKINSSPATSDPYSGTIVFHLLWTSLRAF